MVRSSLHPIDRPEIEGNVADHQAVAASSRRSETIGHALNPHPEEPRSGISKAKG